MNRKLRLPFEAPRCTVLPVLTEGIVCSSGEIPDSGNEPFNETEFNFNHAAL